MLKPSILLLTSILTVSLMACSQPTITQNSTSQSDTSKTITQAKPTYTTTSYILAEPLPNKKVKISITAKDKSLFIMNCNEHILHGVYDNPNNNSLTQITSNACASNDVAIPAQATLSFVRELGDVYDIDGKPLNLSLDKTYYIKVGGIRYYDKNQQKVSLDDTQITSNPFKILP